MRLGNFPELVTLCENIIGTFMRVRKYFSNYFPISFDHIGPVGTMWIESLSMSMKTAAVKAVFTLVYDAKTSIFRSHWVAYVAYC